MISFFACNSVKNDQSEEDVEEKRSETVNTQPPSTKTQKEPEEKSQEEEKINFDSLSIKDRARFLGKYLALLPKGQSRVHEIYFKLFPNNFSEFTMIFGYYGTVDKYGLPEHYGILIESSKEHIDAFFDGLDLPVESLADKLIEITKESEWQADGVNIFQRHLKTFTEANLELVLNKLGQRDEEIVRDYWYFLHSGPHPKNNEDYYLALRAKVNEMAPSLVKALDEIYNELREEEDH